MTYVVICAKKAKGYDLMCDIDMEFLSLLFQYLGLKFKPSIEIEPYGGKQLANGTWTGVIGRLLRGEADIALNLMDTFERRSVIEFTEAYRYSKMSFAMQMPQQFHDSYEFLQPLNTLTWFSLIFFLLFFTFLISKSKSNVSYFRCLYDLIGSFFHQSSHQYRLYPKYLLGLWICLITFLSYSYIAVLSMNIIVPKYEYMPKNIPELLEGVRNNKFRLFFSIKAQLLFSVEKSDFRAVYVAEKHVFDLLTEMHPVVPKFYIIPDTQDSYHHAFGMKNSFCCKDSLNVAIERAISAGIYQKISEEHEFRLRAMLQNYFKNGFEEPYRPLSVNGIKIALFILTGGWILSTVTLVVEIFYNRYQEIKKKKGQN